MLPVVPHGSLASPAFHSAAVKCAEDAASRETSTPKADRHTMLTLRTPNKSRSLQHLSTSVHRPVALHRTPYSILEAGPAVSSCTCSPRLPALPGLCLPTAPGSGVGLSLQLHPGSLTLP